MKTPLLPALSLCLLSSLLLAGEGEKSEKADRKRDEHGQRVKAAIAEKDTDGDGRLSVAEFGAGEQLFRLIDKNGDGYLDSADFAGPKKPRRGDARKGKRKDADPEQTRRRVNGFLQRYDKNGDKLITQDEMPERGRRNFKQVDQNGDGALDMFELTAMMQQGDRGRRGGQDGGERLMRMLEQADANGDGKIDRAEFKGRPEMFGRLDQNGDGVVTKEEIRATIQRMGERGRKGQVSQSILRRFDKDKDGKVSREEWQLNAKLFDRFDIDGDGFISADEVMTQGPRRGRQKKGSPPDPADILAKYDRNKDGKIQAAEFPNERRFAEMDTDGDGIVTMEELQEALIKTKRETGYGFLEKHDANGDGRVTRAEFSGPLAEFERRDANHDGVIDSTDNPDKK